MILLNYITSFLDTSTITFYILYTNGVDRQKNFFSMRGLLKLESLHSLLQLLKNYQIQISETFSKIFIKTFMNVDFFRTVTQNK